SHAGAVRDLAGDRLRRWTGVAAGGGRGAGCADVSVGVGRAGDRGPDHRAGVDLHLPPDGTGPAGVDRPVGQRVVHDDARAGRPVRIPFAGAGFQLGAGVSVLRLTGNQSAISPARTPDSCNVPAATASVTVSSPVASRSQVRGSVSTTFGGFPRLCLVPEMHCTATN